MEKNFWIERWERAETGFHQNQINPYLIQHWDALHPPVGSLVFVPLCGKSQDMLWLRNQGHRVLGVELSEIPVQDFFAECTPDKHGKFDRYEADGIQILCGDFFDLQACDLAEVRLVYDRASLIALPVEMRERYAAHLVKILPPATQILLVTASYPQQEMKGPPFSVSAAEIEALYREHAEIRLLAEHDVLALNPHFKKRGLSQMQENIYLLQMHPLKP
jgi:thiopurine S-methyltransferase